MRGRGRLFIFAVWSRDGSNTPLHSGRLRVLGAAGVSKFGPDKLPDKVSGPLKLQMLEERPVPPGPVVDVRLGPELLARVTLLRVPRVGGA